MSNPLPILFEDPYLLVVDKPAGLLTVGDSSRDEPGVAEVLQEQDLAATPVHRLDRDVSGALLCARDRATRTALETLFRDGLVRKTYWALVRGHVRPPNGELKYPLVEERGRARVSAAGKRALTRYRTMCLHAQASELEVELVTGRYNQIRVHFAHAGFPLVGERKYATGKGDPIKASRVALHSRRLAFAHPATRATIDVEAPLAADLVALVERVAAA